MKAAGRENCMVGALSPVSLAPRADDEMGAKKERKGNEKKPSSRFALFNKSSHGCITIRSMSGENGEALPHTQTKFCLFWDNAIFLVYLP